MSCFLAGEPVSEAPKILRNCPARSRTEESEFANPNAGDSPKARWRLMIRVLLQSRLLTSVDDMKMSIDAWHLYCSHVTTSIDNKSTHSHCSMVSRFTSSTSRASLTLEDMEVPRRCIPIKSRYNEQSSCVFRRGNVRSLSLQRKVVATSDSLRSRESTL